MNKRQKISTVVLVHVVLPFVLCVNSGGFPNSIVTPIRGWRSWNAVFSDVTQDFIARQVEGITQRRLRVDGVPTSLLDLGYDRVGVDSGWAACTGVNGSWHDASGHFIVNKTLFPDMKAMVDGGHAHGVKMDIYLNQDLDPGFHNCKSEGAIPGAAANTGNDASYANDANDIAALGFDGCKFDAGGGNDNMSRWAAAINATGREILIENCNNGGYVPYIHAGGPDEGCPFNMFRTGGDISPSPVTVLSNLMDTARYLNVSKPGCWAYPDMLELGCPVVGPHASRPDPAHPNGRHSSCSASDAVTGDTGPRLSLEQGKAQFAAWCTVSSPLILAFDLGNTTEYDKWFPYITNRLALKIQGSWAGLAGKLLQAGPVFDTVVPHGASCETLDNGHAKSESLPSYSVWGKPVNITNGNRAWAVTALNSVDSPQKIVLDLNELGMGGEGVMVKETDVWSGMVSKVGKKWQTHLEAGAHRFVLLEEVTRGGY